MRAIFEIHSGPSVSKFWLKPGQTVRIGRTMDADHTIADAHLSSLHCELECRQSECIVRDLRSLNGTTVNDTQIDEQRLADGDTIKIGNTRLVVTLDGVSTHALQPKDIPAAMSPPSNLKSGSNSLTPLVSARPPDERGTEPRDAVGREGLHARNTALAKTPKIVQPRIEQVVLEVSSDGADVSKHWIKPGQSAHVGRSSQCDHSFPQDHLMSTRHFVLECGDRVCELRDLNSSNGTFVDGQRISTVIVRDGQSVVAGKTKFGIRINYALGGNSAAMSDVPCYVAARQESGALAFELGPHSLNCVEIIRLISDLSRLYLIVAPKRVTEIPDCVESTYLCNWLPTEVASRLSPIVLASAENSVLRELVQDHWGQDRLFCVFSQCESEEAVAHLAIVARGQEARDQVPVEAHMFGSGSPSRLGPLLANCDPGFAAFVFSKLDAVLLETADGYLLLGGEKLRDDLEHRGFIRRQKLDSIDTVATECTQ